MLSVPVNNHELINMNQHFNTHLIFFLFHFNSLYLCQAEPSGPLPSFLSSSIRPYFLLTSWLFLPDKRACVCVWVGGCPSEYEAKVAAVQYGTWEEKHQCNIHLHPRTANKGKLMNTYTLLLFLSLGFNSHIHSSYNPKTSAYTLILTLTVKFWVVPSGKSTTQSRPQRGMWVCLERSARPRAVILFPSMHHGDVISEPCHICTPAKTRSHTG